MQDKAEIAHGSYRAYLEKDRAAIEALLAEDFHFTSPLDNRIDRKAYFALCWPSSETIEAFEFIHTVVDGERVFVTYEGRRKGGARFRNTEIATIRDGLIAEVEVYFGWNIPHEAGEGQHIDPK